MIKKIFNVIILIMIPVVIFAVCSLVAPGFGLHSISVVFSQAVIPICMGFGIAFTMEAGIFDLSAGSRVLLGAAVGALMANNLGWGLGGLIVGSIVAGVLVSMLMGLAQNVLKIPSLILSLGFVMLLEVVTAALLGDNSYILISSDITFIGQAPFKYLITAILGVVFFFLYYHTRYSAHVKVVGENEILAKNMGINIPKVKFMSYTIGGVFLGVTGILQICYSGSVGSSVGMSSMSLIFQPMMGVMIGIELMGLLNNFPITIVIGEISITILYNAIIGMGVSSTMQNVVLGVFMIIVMSISAKKAEVKAFLQRMKTRKKMGVVR